MQLIKVQVKFQRVPLYFPYRYIISSLLTENARAKKHDFMHLYMIETSLNKKRTKILFPFNNQLRRNMKRLGHILIKTYAQFSSDKKKLTFKKKVLICFIENFLHFAPRTFY